MDASKARYRLGALSRVTAEAVGEPGKRTFRLILESGAASASLWLEKEQLYQLALYIQEIINSLSENNKSIQGDAPEPEWSGAVTRMDFKVGKLALGHDSASNCMLLLTHDVEEAEAETATLSSWLTLSQSEELAKEAVKVCEAGRPRCQLCGQPINPDGHMCVKANGHAPLEP